MASNAAVEICDPTRETVAPSGSILYMVQPYILPHAALALAIARLFGIAFSTKILLSAQKMMKLTRIVWMIFGLVAASLVAPPLAGPGAAQETSSQATSSQDLIPLDESTGEPEESSQDLISQVDDAIDNTVRPRTFRPGRATQGGPSYIGVGVNFGALGDGSLGDTSFAAVSKIGLTQTFSVRPGVVTDFADDATFLVPITYDFASIRLGGLRLSPYAGGGAVVNTDGDAGFLLTGGLDVPLTRRWTINASANAGFIDDTDVSVITSIGYNF